MVAQARKIWHGIGPLLLAVAALTGCSWLTSPADHKESSALLAHSAATAPIPPSFLGHPVAFFAAVFGQLLTFSIAMAVLFYYLHHLDLKRDGCTRLGVRTWKSPVNVYRLRTILFMLAYILGVGGNLLIYLSWGEVSNATLDTFYTIEKIGKALVIFPFAAGVFLLVEMDEITTMQLAADQCAEPLWPPSKILGEYRWMLVWVFIGAFAVTYAKLNSGL